MIISIAYQADHAILEIDFKSGSTYQYFGVPGYIYDEFVRADSPGAFFDLYIKKMDYVYEQVK